MDILAILHSCRRVHLRLASILIHLNLVEFPGKVPVVMLIQQFPVIVSGPGISGKDQPEFRILRNLVQQFLVLHADNSGRMTGSTLVATLERLGILPSFSRPSVAADTPSSEALTSMRG